MFENNDMPMDEEPPIRLERRDFYIAALATGLALVAYGATLAPTVTGEDSGELVAAAYVLGIPHPTGYPLWCLLAKAFMVAIPFGEVAWRAGLLSAVLGALCAGVTTLVVVALARDRFAGLVGGLALAFSFEFWEQSVIAEVYTLNAFLTAACVLFLILWKAERKPPYLYGAALACGLGLANHSTMFLLAPVFGAFVLVYRPAKDTRLRVGLRAAGLVAAGLSLYLYLPLRSMADPAMDWGNPETLGGFWDVFTRTQYRHLVMEGPRLAGRFVDQLSVFATTYLRQFTIPVGLVAVYGLFVAVRRRPAETIFLLAVFIVVALGAIVIPNFNIEYHAIWMNGTFWIPAYCVAAIFIGLAVADFRRWAESEVPQTILGVIVVSIPLIANYQANDRSEYYFARDYAANLLATMEPDALYFGTGDHTVFPLVYLQLIEDLGAEVTIANRYGYLVPEAYESIPEAERPILDGFPNAAQSATMRDWLLEHDDRPIYSPVRLEAPGKLVESVGLLYRHARTPRGENASDVWDRYTWHSTSPADAHGDWAAEMVVHEYQLARARRLFAEDNAREALAALGTAAHVVHGDKRALNNIGILCGEYGHLDEAVYYLDRAVRSDPRYVIAQVNLARAYLKQGDFARALEWAERALSLDSTNKRALSIKEKSRRGLEKTTP